MSLRALTWALEQAPVKTPHEHVILIALADRADDEGRAAWPSQEWLAKRARCTPRTVRRYLAAMQARGVIVAGDQRLVAHIRPDRRPKVWDLNLGLRHVEPEVLEAEVVDDQPVDNSPEERGDTESGRSDGVTDTSSVRSFEGAGGHLGYERPDTAVSYKPSIEPPNKKEGGYVTGELTTREDSPVDNPHRPHPLHVGCTDRDCAECAELEGIQRAAAIAVTAQRVRPSRTCAYHPDGTDHPCAACAHARQYREAWDAEYARYTAERAAEARFVVAESRAARIAECRMCDSDGFIAPTLACTHDPHAIETARRGIAQVRAVLRAKTGDPTPNPVIAPVCPSTPLLAGEQTALEARR